MEFDQILQELKKKIYHPVYFLSGEEPYYIDIISDYIENNVLSEEEKSFNQIIFYGKDTEPISVIEAARRYPMMANQQVIIVKEAQTWKDLSLLQKYLAAPAKTTILVINYKYKKVDGRTEFSKIVKKSAVLYESKKIKDYQTPGWIENFVKQNNYSITSQASLMLAGFLGEDLSKIVNELNKLFIVVPPGVTITPEHIEKNIGISKDYNVIELGNAFGARDILKVNRIMTFFGKNPNTYTIPPITGYLFSYFSKLFRYHFLSDKSESGVAAALGLPPFIAKKIIEEAKRYHRTKLFEIIGIIREYDMKSKGLESSSGVENTDLLKEMAYKILH